MLWCDKLASTPTLGFKLDYHFVSGSALLDMLSPILETLVKGDKQHFQIEKVDASSVQLATNDGFQYLVNPSNVSIVFRHSIAPKFISGKPPEMEMLSKPLPYTKLIEEVTDKLIKLALCLPNANARKITRIGIVSNTAVALGDLPPGIGRLINYVARPWRGELDACAFQIIGRLGAKAGTTDRCIHHIAKGEDPEQLLSIMFDWQRSFEPGRSLHLESLKTLVEEAKKGAFKYFEELAEGNIFDEDLLAKAT